MIRAPFRIVAFPKSGHPYLERFYRCVEAEGAQVIEGDFSGRWIAREVSRGDVLHFHWPSLEYENRNGRLALLRSFARWMALILIGRLKGARIVWTAHNLLPHERSRVAYLDVLGRRLIIGLASIILVHGPSAASLLLARFPKAAGKVVLIPHGNWIGYYPTTCTRRVARSGLGILESTFTFLFIGLCAPYKNLDGLVRAFRELRGDVSLVVAGKFSTDSYREDVARLAAGDPRIHLHAGYIPNERIHTYVIACDAVVVPYREVLTSGTAVLALSIGRPVVSVSLGFLRDVVTPQVGILFEPDSHTRLVQALTEVRVRRFDEATILQHAQGYTYEEAGRSFVGALDRLRH